MKNKLSHSSITMYLESSMKWFLHYREKIRPVKTKSALVFGNALDAAFNSLLQHRNLSKAMQVFMYRMKNVIINNKRVKIDETDLVIYTKNDLDQELLEYFKATEHSNPQWMSLCLKGKLIVEAYYNEVLPRIKDVLSIQKRVRLENADGDSIEGKLDAIVRWEDGNVYLVDNKSSTVRYTPESVKESNQLALYNYIEKDNYPINACGFIVLNKNINKNKTKTCISCGYVTQSNHKKCNNEVNGKRCNGEFIVQIHPTVSIEYIFDVLGDSDGERVIEEFDKVNNLIHNGEFKCPGDNCKSKFGVCQYWNYCRTGDMTGLVKLPERKRKR
jgi:hypothetical protein